MLKDNSESKRIRALMWACTNFLNNLHLVQIDNFVNDIRYLLQKIQNEILKQLDKKQVGEIMDLFLQKVVVMNIETMRKNTQQLFQDEMKKLGVFQLAEEFQNDTDHCLRFVYHFLDDKNLKYSGKNMDECIKNLIGSGKEINCDKLKTSDFIVYNQNGKASHIALFIDIMNKVPYVISKFGKEYKAFIHPIDHLCANYGETSFFSNNIKLNKNTITNFGKVTKDLMLHLNPQAPESVKKEPVVHLNNQPFEQESIYETNGFFAIKMIKKISQNESETPKEKPLSKCVIIA